MKLVMVFTNLERPIYDDLPDRIQQRRTGESCGTTLRGNDVENCDAMHGTVPQIGRVWGIFNEYLIYLGLFQCPSTTHPQHGFRKEVPSLRVKRNNMDKKIQKEHVLNCTNIDSRNTMSANTTYDKKTIRTYHAICCSSSQSSPHSSPL